MLDVHGITVTARNGRTILDQVSLQLDKGEMLAVIGPNGAGKSTLVKSITGLVPSRCQALTFNGASLTNMSRTLRARHIAYMPQATHPVPCSVFDAVLLGRKPHMNWLPSKDDQEKARSVLAELNLDGMRHTCVTRLSGGELQKVLIARALVQEAPVLILDEPVNHLDIRNQVEILDCIMSVTQKRRMCTLIVLHHLNYAMRYAKKVLLLDKGRTIFSGPSSALSASSLSKVYGIAITLRHIDGVPYALF